MAQRYVCIHGHFYQPPRENAWLEEIEIQDSAYPYHDWNERVTAESYAPNSAARILSGGNRIIDIVNNYSRISFNFGPTLLSWMEATQPDTYQAILKADAESQNRFSGHGSAIAQVFNHMIMPLANQRDKETQVRWGIEDFKRRFGRDPEGMWLPETAADTPTLETLAESGISFTILAPSQAKQYRPLGSDDWTDVSDGSIDPKRPYLCRLPSGREITLFFYDGPISQDLGFGDLLSDGKRFADRLTGPFQDNDASQLVHIATDGETYGHHHKHGDMALAYCLYHIDEKTDIKLTIYGEYLEKNPPEYEVEIIENTSWSCVHGVERWRSDCGCHTGGPEGWHQKWRKPLRESLDWLRDTLMPLYEEHAAELFPDPWEARDEYIRVVQDRSQENIEEFFRQYAAKDLDEATIIRALHLLEMQRYAMLMYSSCGWFFNDVSGIETVQVIQYASRAIQMAEYFGQDDLEAGFLERLKNAPSNHPDIETGAEVYTKFVQPARLSLLRVGAHYAISSLFETYEEESVTYCYQVNSRESKEYSAGRIRLLTGYAEVQSQITWDSEEISYAVLYLGDHILNGSVREFQSVEQYQAMHDEIVAAFQNSDISKVLELMDEYFGGHNFTLWHLFKEEQRKVFQQILDRRLPDIQRQFRSIYKEEYPLLKAMHQLDIPIPDILFSPLKIVLNNQIKSLLQTQGPDLDQLQSLIDEVHRWRIEIDGKMLSLVASARICTLVNSVKESGDGAESLSELNRLINLLRKLPVNLDLWEAQNIYYEMSQSLTEEGQNILPGSDDPQWRDQFKQLGEQLQVQIEA